MDKNSTNQGENPDIEEDQEELSKSEALTGIFTEPGSTFEAINKVSKNYWLLPLIITIVLGLISSFLFLSDKELTEKVVEKQLAKVREKMEENVKSGKMTQEQSTEAIEKTEKFMNQGIFFKIIGYLGGVVFSIVLLFGLSLVYFIFLKILKAEFSYMNLLNVIGLAMIIHGIGGLIHTVISIITGDLTSVSLGMLLSESSVGGALHAFLLKLDVFAIWFFILISIGLVKIGKIKSAISYTVVFGIWLLFYIVTIFVFKSY
jgi:hypothetical protein